DLVEEAVTSMSTLNRAAAEAMLDVGVHAATDVTGFGLLGHLSEMTSEDGLGARIHASRVPVLSGAKDLAGQDVIPGGTRRNEAAVAPLVDWDDDVPDITRALLCDAQTSG